MPMQVGIAVGNTAYAEPAVDQISFSKLKSAELDVQLPATPGGALVKTTLNPAPIPGAIYEGLLVGVVGGKGGVIKPISATWPDAAGNFRLVLPGSAKGQAITFWQADRQFFSTQTATPGGAVDLTIYPKSLPTDAPQGLTPVKLAG